MPAARPAPRSASASEPTRWSAASGNTIALQPLSLEGNTGLNVAGGIGAIQLSPARR